MYLGTMLYVQFFPFRCPLSLILDAGIERFCVLRLDIDIDLMNYSILKCTLRFDKILFLFFSRNFEDKETDFHLKKFGQVLKFPKL